MRHSYPRRAWLVFCDHSFVGFWPSKKAAEKAARLRQHYTISNIDHFVVGPFALEKGAKVTKLPPEWISRCACGATYQTERQWDYLPLVGRMPDGSGAKLELRNCVACNSTISRRIQKKTTRGRR